MGNKYHEMPGVLVDELEEELLTNDGVLWVGGSTLRVEWDEFINRDNMGGVSIHKWPLILSRKNLIVMLIDANGNLGILENSIEGDYEECYWERKLIREEFSLIEECKRPNVNFSALSLKGELIACKQRTADIQKLIDEPTLMCGNDGTLMHIIALPGTMMPLSYEYPPNKYPAMCGAAWQTPFPYGPNSYDFDRPLPLKRCPNCYSMPLYKNWSGK